MAGGWKRFCIFLWGWGGVGGVCGLSAQIEYFFKINHLSWQVAEKRRFFINNQLAAQCISDHQHKLRKNFLTKGHRQSVAQFWLLFCIAVKKGETPKFTQYVLNINSKTVFCDHPCLKRRHKYHPPCPQQQTFHRQGCRCPASLAAEGCYIYHIDWVKIV